MELFLCSKPWSSLGGAECPPLATSTLRACRELLSPVQGRRVHTRRLGKRTSAPLARGSCADLLQDTLDPNCEQERHEGVALFPLLLPVVILTIISWKQSRIFLRLRALFLIFDAIRCYLCRMGRTSPARYWVCECCTSCHLVVNSSTKS